MTIARVSKWLFVGTGVYALLCAPAILLAERYSWPQSPLHATQFLAAFICFPSSLLFLWFSRDAQSGVRRLAVAAAILSAAWLAFVVYVLLTLDFSSMD